MGDPLAEFHSWGYLRHNQRRQEHLASLALPLAGRTVIEVGAGIGDHTSFFIDRGCTVLSIEGRAENLRILRERHPQVDARHLDLDDPDPAFTHTAEIVYCYGTLYHLARPAEAIRFIADRTTDLLLLETCVSPGAVPAMNPVDEDATSPSQALGGRGCRPTRSWVRERLQASFPNVYTTLTQPWHDEFPLDWSVAPDAARLTRSVFVASRSPLASAALTVGIPERQTRH